MPIFNPLKRPYRHIWSPIAATVFIASTSALLGCSQPAPSAELFPLAAGHRWTYRVTTTLEGNDATPMPPRDFSIGTLGRDTLSGIKDLEDGPAMHRRSDDGVHYWLRTDATGTYRVASRFDLDDAPIADRTRRYVLKEPLTPGTQWQADTTSYLMQRHNEFPREIRHSHPKLPMTYTIDALNQKISTPAGDFDHCVLVKGLAQVRLYIDPVAGWKDVPLHTREWYCPGVGLVKLVREELTSAQFLTGGTQTMELQTWH